VRGTQKSSAEGEKPFSKETDIDVLVLAKGEMEEKLNLGRKPKKRCTPGGGVRAGEGICS